MKQTKIKLCSVVEYYRFLLCDYTNIDGVFGQWVYSLIIINCGTTYNLSYWYRTILLNTSMC